MLTAVCDLFYVSTLPGTQMESLFTSADKRFFSASVECQNYTENLLYEEVWSVICLSCVKGTQAMEIHQEM